MAEMGLVVVGAAGRMGRMLVKAVTETDGCRLVAAVEREGSLALGEDAGLLAGVAKLNVPITDDPVAAFAKSDGVLDFSTPAATVAFAEIAARDRLVHVVGTTGLGPSDFEALRAAAARSRVIQSGNMSLGVNLLAGLVRKVAATLGQNFDIEILEMHHRAKVDAPSGTAILLGEAAAEGRSVDFDERRVAARDGLTGARQAGDIGFAVLRGGSVVGDHTVIFAGPGERLELTHRAEDRSLFALGAIKAAMWGFNRDPGYYTMADVLGLSSTGVGHE